LSAVRRNARNIAATLPVLAFVSWALAALWIDGVAAGAFGFVAAVGALLFWLRPYRRALLSVVGICVAVLAWWSSIEPGNDRDWLPDVARAPTASIDCDLVTIRKVRNFDYRSETDFDERWEERSYDLSKLIGVDMFMSYWGSPWIAHTIVSWEFDDGQHLAISIETRKEVGESYSAVLGFFRQYELYYVAADERDVIGVRANHRGEDVSLYRLRTPIPVARAILLDYLKSMNSLVDEPTWYNALTTNCTTTIRRHARHVGANNPFNWKILVNGYINEFFYDRGTIDDRLPFEELKRRSEITKKARSAGNALDFSRQIRVDLPGENRLPVEPANSRI